MVDPAFGHLDPSLPEYSWDGTERLNMLLIGYDSGPGRVDDLTDTILVVSIDPVSKSAFMVSIPRDTGYAPLPDRRVYADGIFPRRINELASDANADPGLWCPDLEQNEDCGLRMLRQSVGLYLGLEINNVGWVDLQGFAALVDAMGGVDLCLPGTLADPEYGGPTWEGQRGVVLEAGCQHYDGPHALAFARVRKGTMTMPDGTVIIQNDFLRAERQQEFLLAVQQRLASANLLITLPGLLNAVSETVTTDFPRSAGRQPGQPGAAHHGRGHPARRARLAGVRGPAGGPVELLPAHPHPRRGARRDGFPARRRAAFGVVPGLGRRQPAELRTGCRLVGSSYNGCAIAIETDGRPGQPRGGVRVSTTEATSVAGRQLRTMQPQPLVLTAAGLMLLAVLAAQVSTVAFLVAGVALLGLLGVMTLRWPRAMLVALVMSPAIIDLYAGQRLLPETAQEVARFFSEGLLMVVALVLASVAARRGTLVGALAHPFSGALALFLLATVVSAAVNAVPPQVAATGLIFTLDAAVLFYLPRMVGFTHEQIRLTMWAVAIVVVVTALIGIGQAILSPDLLGVTPVTGRSGEGVRFGSLVRDPNIMGTLIGLALPFTVFSLVRMPPGRNRWLVGGAVLALLVALLLTYSRGSWLGVAVGFGGVALIIDRRALVTFLALLLLAYGTAVVMPKGILSGLGQGYDPFATTVNRFDAVNQGQAT